MQLTSYRDMKKRVRKGTKFIMTQLAGVDVSKRLTLVQYDDHGFECRYDDGSPILFRVSDRTFTPINEGFAIATALGLVVAQFKTSDPETESRNHEDR